MTTSFPSSRQLILEGVVSIVVQVQTCIGAVNYFENQTGRTDAKR